MTYRPSVVYRYDEAPSFTEVPLLLYKFQYNIPVKKGEVFNNLEYDRRFIKYLDTKMSFTSLS